MTSPAPPARARHAAAPRLPLWRTAALLLAVAALGAGLFFAWNWLAAGGVFVLLVAALPCAAMCLLGFCFKHDGPRPPPGGTSDGSGS